LINHGTVRAPGSTINVAGNLSVPSGEFILTDHDNIRLTIAGNTTVSGGISEPKGLVP
jgi:hypothetical protein